MRRVAGDRDLAAKRLIRQSRVRWLGRIDRALQSSGKQGRIAPDDEVTRIHYVLCEDFEAADEWRPRSIRGIL